MNVETSTWKEGVAFGPLVALRRPAAARSAQYVVFSVLGTFVAIIGPALLALFGIGMSRQNPDIACNAAYAALFAIICGFAIIRRLLSLPLLRTYNYVAGTFITSFVVMAVGLKFFRIDFSSPQYFLSLAMIVTMIVLFLHRYRQAAPLHIAVLPGVTCLTELPDKMLRSVKFTWLSVVPKEVDYNGVVADFSREMEPAWEHFLAFAALHGVPVYHIKQFNETINGRVAVDHLWENTLGAIVPALIYPQLKRTVDFLAAGLFLPLIAVLIGICVVLIKIDSPGPALFCQRRTGLGGRSFTMFKLRTMTHNHAGTDFTIANDKRVTRTGRILRQYRLDELPQVINILRGDMSWIGPRPEAISLAALYERELPFYVYRHIVRPGITGWAQVHQGNVSAVDAARLKLEYDFFYIKNFSFWLDVVIVVKTVRTIVTGFGSL
jgi:lipopolysaccharide/colanic/teichoic acid biosynthesis glycosyltransferase